MLRSRQNDSAIRITALLFAGEWAILQVMTWATDGVSLGERFWLGNDFDYLYAAAGLFLAGKSPYQHPDFIPLPPALYLPLLVHRLSYWSAFTAFRVVSFSLAVVAILWLCQRLRLTLVNSALMLLIAITYMPFYQVLAGGNLDALMLALLIFACVPTAAVRGGFLGLSIGTKFYSLLLVPILVVQRRWRELLWGIAVLLFLLIPFARYMPDALVRVFHRTSTFRLGGNQSPAVMFILAFGSERKWAWGTGYALLWGGTLLTRIWADLKTRKRSEELFTAVDYIPWMAAAPVLVFTYTGTILLGYLPRVFARNQTARLRWPECLSVVGFLLTGVYPFFIKDIVYRLWPRLPDTMTSKLLVLLAPMGLTMILIGSALSAWQEPKVEALDPATTDDKRERSLSF